MELSVIADGSQKEAAKDQAEAYDSVPENYSRFYGQTFSGIVHEIYFETAIRLLSPQPGERIIDVGCGVGDLSLMAAQKGALVTGIDISPNQIAYATQRAKQQKVEAHFSVSDVQSITLPESHFDKALFVQVLHRLEAPLMALSGIHKCLKPGGLMVMYTMNLFSPQFRLIQFYMWLRKMIGRPVSERLSSNGFTKNEIMGLLRKSNFEIIHDFTENISTPYAPIFCPDFIGFLLKGTNKILKKIPLVNRLGTARVFVARKL